jgi:hypothetical protein
MPYLVILKLTRQELENLVTTRPDIKPSMAGVYQYPLKEPATCSGWCGKSKKVSGWGRNPDKGYIVHDCGKRHPDWRRRVTMALFDSLGRNLLRKPHTYFKNPETW